jgi:hypothetical protein
MKVKATKIGFYGKLRKVGEVFTIKDEKELGSWMEEVKELKKVKAKAEKK